MPNGFQLARLCHKLPQKHFSLSYLHPHSFVRRSFSPRHGVPGRRRVRPPSPHLRRFPRSVRLQLARAQIYPRKGRAPRPLGHIGRRGWRNGFERRLRRATQSRGQGVHNPFASHM
jgi:hypothetical protein